jgi:hypothetical protein
MGLGCVTTAECDEHVGCSDDFVCYQIQCLPPCDDDGDCDDHEVCAPCDDDDSSSEGRCPGDSGRSACVADEELMNDGLANAEQGED